MHAQSDSRACTATLKEISKEKFLEYLCINFPADAKRTRSALIHQSFGDKIVGLLSGRRDHDHRGETNSKHFRYFVKKNGFRLLDLPVAGIINALVVPVKDAKS